MYENIYKGKRVLITGHTGFKGSWLCAWLLDLGSSPGGWSQVASKKINNGKILAIDIIPMEKVNNVNFLKGDVLDERIHDEIVNYFKGKVDIVISDMAANTTGYKDLD